ncbi:MAG TPA: hypothetical protein VKY85_16010 [Candidatus Angelobacter sp.]|nr:hypothetical protein [Candidatus Angelobacter sp.]
MTKHQRLFAFLCAAAVLAFPWLAESHVPYRPEVIFVSPDYPDRPVSRFAAGRIGVVQPSWAWGYLVVAYRYFNGTSLSAVEQKSFLAQKDLHPGFALKPFDWRYEHLGPPQRWVKARGKFRNTKPPTNQPGADWWEYTDGDGCLAGAFDTAIRTLHDRARRFGANSPQLQEWINGQDQVFMNCPLWGRISQGEVLPQSLPNTADSLLHADRAYQIAAAHFYAHHFGDALRDFEAIARDSTSPWHELGRYLAARTLIQEATISEPDDAANVEILKQAQERMHAFAMQTKDAGLRHSAFGLLNFIAARLQPEQQLRTLCARILQPDADFGQDVSDVSYLLQNKIGPQPDFPDVEDGSTEYDRKLAAWRQERYHKIDEQSSGKEIADWILTMASWSEWSQQHALARWRAGKTLPWLVAAISKANGRDPGSDELLAAAAHVPPESPAYLTLAMHSGRLQRERGEFERARRILDAGLAQAKDGPISAFNLIKKERSLVAAGLDEFVSFLGSRPLQFSNGAVDKGESEYCEDTGWDVKCEKNLFLGPGKEFYPQLDFNAAIILNQRMPIETLVQVARSPRLPENLRLRLAPAIWTRALVLDRPDLARTMASDVGGLRPELKPFIAAYEQAKDPAERKFLAAFAIAHFPGLRPLVEDGSPRATRFDYADNYRDNWWCKDAELEELSWGSSYNKKKVGAVPDPAFLTAQERDVALKERSQLVQIGGPGDWMPAILIDWARKHPDDSRVPEALHFAWRVNRFSCDDSKNRTREIFTLLHSRYPDSPWTKKTKHWY